MRRETAGRLRLLELILDLVVFALCAIVCVVLLVKAQGMSADSRRLTEAVYLAQSAAEEWKATGEVPADCGAPDSEGYTASVTPDGDTADVTISWNGAEIYTIEGVGRNG